MKAYTDLEQSKKLAEILPIESADMRFCFSHTLDGRITGHYPMIGSKPSLGTIPCWSLAALLNVLPKFYNRYKSEFRLKLVRNESDKWCCCYEAKYYTAQCDNPLDACYKIILWLNEQKRL